MIIFDEETCKRHLDMWLNADLAVATYIDLSRADIQNGVNQLEAYGMIGSGRADQILTAPIQDIERITT